ncbi:hypothetical protein K435DRAFT_860978 [Dendrothele bispora CBS 962.96]|uniref:Uncharacterized protein n=1 Tax=Dendrothele bispora (strain CBS 962.96) TaxID=1314807 RepID=A0A4S8LWH3_DENBC|nr:hypothetical protein K435DRAFT_860978 [Dendrothele bispora CBS 962.96]
MSNPSRRSGMLVFTFTYNISIVSNPSRRSGMLVFTFTYNIDVTNSIVFGLGNTPQYEVTTESGRYFSQGSGRSFLRLSQDRKTMFYGNRQFTWVPTGNAISFSKWRKFNLSRITLKFSKISNDSKKLTKVLQGVEKQPKTAKESEINFVPFHTAYEIAQSAAQAGMLSLRLISTIYFKADDQLTD